MNSFLTPPDRLRCEPMGPHFTKYHLNNGQVLHRFAESDGGDPHNHPFGFTTHILSGGYIEHVYTLHPDGTATVAVHHRQPGTSHRVEAGTIHRLVELPAGECWTLMEPGPWEQKSGFFRFDEAGNFYRDWDEPEFRRLAA